MLRKAKWVVVVTSAAAGLLVAGAGSASSSRRVPCKLSVAGVRHIAPQGVSGTASVRCSQRESNVALTVAVVRLPRTRVAIRRAFLPVARPDERDSATARTSKCDSGVYETRATVTVAGHKLVARSRPKLIVCDMPADTNCQVAADAPTIVNNDIIGRSDLTCASDRRDLVWSIQLEVNVNGQWQGPSGQQGGYLYRGGTTYHRSVRVPCASQPPPWPRDARTVVDVQPDRGKAIHRTSPVTSITCPTAPDTLSVTLSGTGSGRVTSSPVGIDCPGTCSHAYPAGTNVTLTATPSPNSRFASWTGSFCGGQGPCQLMLVQDTSVGADFELNSGPPAAARSPAAAR